MAASTATNTVIMIAATLLSKILGFARELTLAYVYGANAVSDAYIVAFSLPTIIFSGVGTAILTAYISLYIQLQKNKPSRLQAFSDYVTSSIFLLSLLVVGIFTLLRRPIVRLFAVGFEEETFSIAVYLSQVMMLSLLFISVYYILQGYLQIHGNFLAVGLTNVPTNLFVVAAILLSSVLGYRLLGWGVVAGYAVSFVMLLIAARRRGYRYTPRLDLKDRYLRRLWVMVLPMFLGKSITQLNIMIDRTIASTLPEGAISALNYGNRITGFVTSVFVVSLTTALFPQLSRLSAAQSMKRLKTTFSTSVGIMSLLVIPISAGLMIFSREIVQLLFEHGAFTAQDTERTAQVVFFYAIGLIFFSIKEVAINVFYALQNTKTPTINSLIAMGLNLVLNLILVRKFAHSGLALATSISGAVTLVFLLWSLRKKIGHLGMRGMVKSLLKMTLSAVGLAFAVIPVYDMLFLKTESLTVSFVIAVLVGAVVYFVLNILLRTKEMGQLIIGIVQRLAPRSGAGKRQG